MNSLSNFWAICEMNGDVKVDDGGHVLIFESREVAREYLRDYRLVSTPSRIEKVEVI